jgi:hypothetical protein
MFTEGDKVTYIGKNAPDGRSPYGLCVSGEYEIREWTFINVRFGAESDWHPINVDNLKKRD